MITNLVLDLPAVVWRPMPEKLLPFWLTEIPIPLHSPPEPRGSGADLIFNRCVYNEKFPGCQQRLNHKCGFHQITAIVQL